MGAVIINKKSLEKIRLSKPFVLQVVPKAKPETAFSKFFL